MFGLREIQYQRIALLTIQVQGQWCALLIQHAQGKGDVQRWLGCGFVFDPGGRIALTQGQRSGLSGRVVLQADLNAWRSRLLIPAAELLQALAGFDLAIYAVHAVHEIVASDCLAVMALEVLTNTSLEVFFTQQGVLHANDFRTFLVNCGGVKVADFLIALGADGVSHWAGIFRELGRAQDADIINAFDGAGAGGLSAVQPLSQHVSRKLLIAENRQTFFQGKLEPVAASDAVAGPVMEVLMANNCFHGVKGRIGSALCIGQHVGGIKDVQALVLHRAHIEVASGHNHEAVQIQFQPKTLLIPAYRMFQAFHGPFCFIAVTTIAINLQ